MLPPGDRAAAGSPSRRRSPRRTGWARRGGPGGARPRRFPARHARDGAVLGGRRGGRGRRSSPCSCRAAPHAPAAAGTVRPASAGGPPPGGADALTPAAVPPARCTARVKSRKTPGQKCAGSVTTRAPAAPSGTRPRPGSSSWPYGRSVIAYCRDRDGTGSTAREGGRMAWGGRHDQDRDGAAERGALQTRSRSLADRLRGDPGLWRRGVVLAVCSVLLALPAGAARAHPQRGRQPGQPHGDVPAVVRAPRARPARAGRAAPLRHRGGRGARPGAGVGQRLRRAGDGQGRRRRRPDGRVPQRQRRQPGPQGTADTVAGSGADVVALVELKASMVPVYERALADAYRTTRCRAPSACGASTPWLTAARSTSAWAGPGPCAPRWPPRGATSPCTWRTCRRCGSS